MDKLNDMTTHAVPARISPAGNSAYNTFQNLLDKSPNGGCMIGILCSTIALILGENYSECVGREDDSSFRYGDNVVVSALSPSLFYSASSLHPNDSTDKITLSRFINHKLIETGYQKVISSRGTELCDLFIEILSD